MRVVAATARDLARAVQEGHFREDLFYRLNVVNLRLPSLRERPDDVPRPRRPLPAPSTGASGPRRPSGASPRRRWSCSGPTAGPGNVRELEHAVERAVVLADGPLIEEADLPDDVRAGPPGRRPAPRARRRPLGEAGLPGARGAAHPGRPGADRRKPDPRRRAPRPLLPGAPLQDQGVRDRASREGLLDAAPWCGCGSRTDIGFPAGFLIRTGSPAYRDPTMPVRGPCPSSRRPGEHTRGPASSRSGCEPTDGQTVFRKRV